jgi:hypothetical protein
MLASPELTQALQRWEAGDEVLGDAEDRADNNHILLKNEVDGVLGEIILAETDELEAQGVDRTMTVSAARLPWTCQRERELERRGANGTVDQTGA